VTWHQEANCLGANPEVFFPERGDTDGVRVALAICAGCPVVEQCLAENIESKDGIYGATTGAQRRKIRSERGAGRSCAWCSAAFTARYAHTVVCSDECRKARRAAKQAESNARTAR
jgi:WhiB family redox-sensing transcriptional regulator